MKDLTIKKLDPKDMGQYHIRRKVNEIVDTVNELVKFMQALEYDSSTSSEITLCPVCYEQGKKETIRLSNGKCKNGHHFRSQAWKDAAARIGQSSDTSTD